MNRFNGQAGPGGSVLLTPGQGVQGAYSALGYKAAAVERRSAGRQATPGSGDYHLRHDRLMLGQIADRFMRDNGIYRGIVSRFVDAVYGAKGFLLDVTTGNKSVDKRTKERWRRFTEDPEVRGLFDWNQAERIALLGVANHGDVGAIHTNRGKFQFVESEEIGGRSRLSRSEGNEGQRWESGVLLDEFGRPITYRIHPRSRQGHVQTGKGKKVAAKDFTFMANRERFSQTRGVPILVSTFAMVHRISDVIDSEAVAWQNLSKFALTITRENSAEQAYNESTEDSDGRAANEGDIANRVMELEEAILFFANTGETIKGIERNLPGKDFPASVRMFLRLIGLPLGIPLEVILLDYSNTSYSSARASLEQAYRMFVVWQSFIKRSWHTPLYRRWLGWELEAKTLPAHPALVADAKGAGKSHSWIAPEFPWIDHLKEAEAWGMRMDRGLATQAMALRSINMDHDEWLETRCAEVEKAIQCADKINKANPDANVDWRMFAAVPVSKSQGMQDPPGAPPPGDPPPTDASNPPTGFTPPPTPIPPPQAPDVSVYVEAPPPAVIHNHVAQAAAPNVALHVPEFPDLPAPIVEVIVEAPPAPDVSVTVEAAAPAQAPDVSVTVEAAKAPDVTVTIPEDAIAVDVKLKVPRKRVIVDERDALGRIKSADILPQADRGE